MFHFYYLPDLKYSFSKMPDLTICLRATTYYIYTHIYIYINKYMYLYIYLKMFICCILLNEKKTSI